jgi:TonB-linked SusC/RagA family outer membrane protein
MKNSSLFRGWRWQYVVLLICCQSFAISHTKLSPFDCAQDDTHRMTEQQQTLSGTVTFDNMPITGVTVTNQTKQITAITDTDGRFSIEAIPGDVLNFSYTGFKTVTLTLSGYESLKIAMQEDTTTLKEVIINAGYYKVKDKERTGSIAKITSKDIEQQPVTNVLAVMQGRMAGVNITQTTGVPGGGFDIQIRGLNSVRRNGNDPLYVIDDVPYSSEAIGSGQNSAVLPTQPSPLNSINPDQIESIEVLKDADATAIYGSRGANGVVLITTKKGKAGKTRFTANVSTGVGTVTRFMDLLNTEQYIAMRTEAFANDGFTELPDYAYDVNGTWDRTRYTDWQKELLGGTAEITDMQAGISGGSAQTQFLLSANLNKQTTVFPGDWNYKKGNVHIGINHESDDKRFRSAFTAGYTVQNNLQPRTDLTVTALSLAPNAPALYDAQGKINWENSTWNNPLGDLVPQYEAKTYDLIANSVLSYELFKGLEVKSSFGYTTLTNDEVTAIPSTRYDPAAEIGPENSQLIVGRAARRSWIVEPQLNWRKQLGNTKLDVLVGGSLQSQKGTLLTQLGSNFSSNSLIYDLASAATINTLISTESEYKYQAFFGRVNLNWKDKYIVNLTGRRDGSSRFGPGKQYANFGAVGAAWLFSEEKPLKGSSILSFGKLRASYGITGNDQIGDYQYLETYESTGVNYNGTIGLQPARLYNRDFGWETNKKFEAGLDTGFLKDRIFVTAAWYRNHSSNQLTGMPLPGTTGFTSMTVNMDATVENTGTEFTLRTVNFQQKDFNWTSSLNLTMSRNKLLSFPDLENSVYKNTYVVGESLNIRKVYHSTGVDPQTGLYTFEDADGNGLIDSNDRIGIADFSPKYFAGLQNSIRYKRWQLDFLFQFVKQDNYNEVAFFNLPGMMYNQPVSVLDHWQQPGDIAAHQLYTDGSNFEAFDNYDLYYNSDAAVSDASYVRLKNLSLAFDVPENWLKSLKCRLYFEGQNLLTFTNYSGADPEFKSSGYLPPLRVLSAGVQLSF